MGERALIKNSTEQVQTRRREIQIRREKEHAIAQYNRMASKARKEKKAPLPSKAPVSMNHAIFFTVCLGVASIVLPQLTGLATIFAILILGNALNEQFAWFKKSEETKITKGNMSDDKMIRMVKPDTVKLSSKRAEKLPVAKTAKGINFKDADGGTITQFDWRQLTQ